MTVYLEGFVSELSADAKTSELFRTLDDIVAFSKEAKGATGGAGL